jgi:HK97 family phage portal protein
MKPFTALRYGLARLLVKGMAWSYTPTWVYRGVLSPVFATLVKEGYAKNAAFFACVSALAFSFPEPPMHVYDGEGEHAERLDAHPLRTLITKPNADMGEAELKLFIIVWLAIGGNCYLHKLRNASGRVIGLRPYHDGVMRAESAGDGADSWIVRYWFRQSDGTEAPVPREDIIHLRWPSPDPRQPWTAQPPIIAAAREVDADNEASRYIATLLQNDAIPRTVITQSKDMALTPAEVSTMKAEWAQQFGGDNRGGVAVLEAGVTVTRLAMDMEQLGMAALHDIPEQRICAVMRVPPSVAGLGDDPTYANSEEAWSRFTMGTLAPLWRIVESALTADLGVEFGGVVLRHDLSRVRAFQEDETARQGRIDASFTAGYLSFQAARGLIGQPAEPAPDELFMTAAGLVPYVLLRPSVSGEPAAKSGAPILGYHIETGVVSRNEARAQLGLPPEDDSQDSQMRRLQSVFAVMTAAIGAGYTPDEARTLVGMAGAPKARAPLALEAKALEGLDGDRVAAIERRIEAELRTYLTNEYATAATGVEQQGEA